MPDVENLTMRNWHVTFVVHKNKVIATGTNRATTHPTNLKNRKRNSCGIDYSATKFTCSEQVAINRAKRTTNVPFSKVKLVNVRINRKNEVCLSRPCESCCSLLNFFGVSDVFFSNDSGEFEKHLSNNG